MNFESQGIQEGYFEMLRTILSYLSLYMSFFGILKIEKKLVVRKGSVSITFSNSKPSTNEKRKKKEKNGG